MEFIGDMVHLYRHQNHKLIAQEFNYRGPIRNDYVKEQLKSAKDSNRISDLVGAQ